uniref:BMA-LIN-22, isoform c n=1 Tax=Brugia malayi TaxID=6279 RepID=A0A0J9Y3B4_BRUMA|nr:BMA-LIN-22, isoform c [Brugia malayi]
MQKFRNLSQVTDQVHSESTFCQRIRQHSMSQADVEKSDLEKGKTLTKKSNKPLIERKRRERINKCLFEMKQMLVDDVKNRSPSHFKWEKADVLEMSVAYIRQLRRCIAANSKAKKVFSLPYFVDGFSNCVREMQNYTLLEKWPVDLREYNNRLTSHLNARLHLLISEPAMKHETMSASLLCDCTGANIMYYNNHAYNNYQQTKIMQPSTFEILNHTNSVGCMIGTSRIKAHSEEKIEANCCEKAYLFRDNKFNDHSTANEEFTKTSCGGHRLWRPF